MFTFVIYVCLLSTATDVAHGRFQDLPQLPDGITVHNVLQIWEEAVVTCQSEGAILASPINQNVFNAMKSLMNATRSTFYIGAKASQHPGRYVSLEGIPLENMTIAWHELDPSNGDCLAMTSEHLRVVPCETRLPYMCIKADIFNKIKIETSTKKSSELCDKDVAHGRFLDLPQLPDGITVHNVLQIWEEAVVTCQSEGAILASPINENVFNAMKSLMNATRSTFYIGAKASQHPGRYVSLEGIPLENMTIAWHELDPSKGDCLAMTSEHLRVVPCETWLPYMCIKTDIFNKIKIETSTKKSSELCDKGYTYHKSTQHCYKVHKEAVEWSQARLTCISEGGDLAVIDNANEAEVIKNMYGFDDYFYIYIGLHKTKNGNWQWIDGRPVESLFNVLRNYQMPQNAELACGSICINRLLYDIICAFPLPFICEKEPTV